jgi:hypothetical protein
MSKRQLKELTDKELLNEAKKIKSTQIIDATLIGVLIYSITVGNFNSFFALILLYAIYKQANKDNYKKKQLKIF